MFGKATVKRFNDVKEVTPGASDYDVKEPVKKGSNAAVVKSERFLDPKMVTPGKIAFRNAFETLLNVDFEFKGPGHYDTSVKTRKPTFRSVSLHVKSNLSVSSKNSSRNSSRSSLYTEIDDDICFKTPVKMNGKKDEEYKELVSIRFMKYAKNN